MDSKKTSYVTIALSLLLFLAFCFFFHQKYTISAMISNRSRIHSQQSFFPVPWSPGSVGGHFQRALEARGIRCSSGAGTDLLKTAEIGTLRALLQTVWNPRQDIPLVAVLASPVFGFTADDLAALRSGHRGGAVFRGAWWAI